MFDLPMWVEFCLIVLAIWVVCAICSGLMHLMGVGFGYPCANSRCDKTLAHADYTSMYCHNCRHLDVELQRDPNQRHYRTQAAYSGDWSKVR